MMKRNKWTLVITTAIMLLPMLIGIFMWKRLPDQVPMHWNIQGEVDGWGSKGMFVFATPAIFIGIQMISLFVSAASTKDGKINKKISALVMWIAPFISILVHTLVYTKILGYDFSEKIVLPLILGSMLIVVGNWLPKCKRNKMVGIKVHWALKDDENWYHTHRFAGKVWVIGGVVILASALLRSLVLCFAVCLVAVLAPIAYSYIFYLKNRS